MGFYSLCNQRTTPKLEPSVYEQRKLTNQRFAGIYLAIFLHQFCKSVTIDSPGGVGDKGPRPHPSPSTCGSCSQSMDIGRPLKGDCILYNYKQKATTFFVRPLKNVGRYNCIKQSVSMLTLKNIGFLFPHFIKPYRDSVHMFTGSR